MPFIPDQQKNTKPVEKKSGFIPEDFNKQFLVKTDVKESVVPFMGKKQAYSKSDAGFLGLNKVGEALGFGPAGKFIGSQSARALGYNKPLEQSIEQNQQLQQELQKRINEKRQRGEDVSKLVEQLSVLSGSEKKAGAALTEVRTGGGLTPRQVFGSGLNVAASLPFTAPIKALSTVNQGSKIKNLINLAKTSALNFGIAGGLSGAGYGLMDKDKSAVDVLKSGVTGAAVGTGIGLTALPIATGVGMLSGKIGSGAYKAGKDLVESGLPKDFTKLSEREIANYGLENINKAIGLRGIKNTRLVAESTTGGADAARFRGFQELAQYDGVPVKGADGIEKPFSIKDATLGDAVQVLHNQKEVLYDEALKQLENAGSLGYKVNTGSIGGYLNTIINSKAYGNTAKRRAKELLSDIREISNPVDARGYIRNELNPRLSAYFSGRADKVVLPIEAEVTRLLTDAYEQTIINSGNQSVKQLMRRHGSLKSIEKDLTQKVIQEARKYNQGIGDYIDVFSYADVLGGVLTGNPALAMRGVAQKGITNYIKEVYKNPNRYLRNALEAASFYNQKYPKTLQFERSQLLRLPPGNTQVPQVQVNTPINLGPRSQSTIDIAEKVFQKLPKSRQSSYLSYATSPQNTANATPIRKNNVPIQGNVSKNQPKSNKLSTGGKIRLDTALIGGTAAGGAALANTPQTTTVKFPSDESNQSVESVNTSPIKVQTKVDARGRQYGVLDSGAEVRPVDPKYAKSISRAYEKYPRIPKGLIEAVLMQESSMGTNSRNSNPNIGMSAWLVGFTDIAKKELGIKNIDTINQAIDAMAAYLDKKIDFVPADGSKKKEILDPVELYFKRYNTTVKDEEVQNKFRDIVNYYASLNKK